MPGSAQSPAASQTPPACRARKIKCSSEDAASTCTRCSKLFLPCVFEAPAIRKKRERNGTRLRELERKLGALQAAISNGLAPNNSSVSTPAQEISQPSSLSTVPGDLTVDTICQGILSEDEARDMYALFYDLYAPIYSLVSPPPPQVWEQVRIKQPALFRAIIASACSSARPELWELLFKDAERFLVDQVMMSGRKSLGLVQAAIILAIWSHPPKKFNKLTFQHLIHMATTLVTDLQSYPEYKIPDTTDFIGIPSGFQLEICRTFLGTYVLSSSFAMSFRRPAVLRCGPWVTNCLRVLDADPQPSLNDQRLSAWTRLQMLVDESLTMIGFEDWSHISMSNNHTRFIVGSCIEKVARWKEYLPEIILNGTLEIHHYMVSLVLHELALYDSYEVEGFRPPYKIPNTPVGSHENPHNISHVKSQSICLAQGLLQRLLVFSNEDLRRMPVIIFVRMMHAVIVFAKLQGPVSPPTFGSPVFLTLLSSLITKLHMAANGGTFRVPGLFHFVLLRLSKWYQSQLMGQISHITERFEPLLSIDVEGSEQKSDQIEVEVLSTPSGIPLRDTYVTEPAARDHSQNPLTTHIWYDIPNSEPESEITPNNLDVMHQIFDENAFDFFPPNPSY
ncbi:hypothetical protein F5Y19DRAFT_480953 [Xylariaceae sp. FL1651]|nr:hypothetical protein F5Y19DRAFT_480953 [Xylariaceae sp. FL1651]